MSQGVSHYWWWAVKQKQRHEVGGIMRCMQRNKQKMHYALLTGEVPIYERDENNNIIHDVIDGIEVPVETGETDLQYSKPVMFCANFSMSGGESKAVEFGIDVSQYDAIIVTSKGALPITETSLIWKESTVGYKDIDKTIVDANTADYKVKKISPSLNQMKYLLEKIVK